MNLKMGGIVKFELLSSYIIVEEGARQILPDFYAGQQNRGE
jgi:hypothetical protein